MTTASTFREIYLGCVELSYLESTTYEFSTSSKPMIMITNNCDPMFTGVNVVELASSSAN